ncbi:uncharacterized protein PSFLO_05670 [Pseudozyma flocculosa]|uniref:Uncharacterized protein n=1 Tax=Pseudozyma flocculosa TaxID=84751 RepID=A0A5C3F6U2_9BASI|nr:uncharacterized protein PSFLO_05670 [Pseudozyma flocculosa]
MDALPHRGRGVVPTVPQRNFALEEPVGSKDPTEGSVPQEDRADRYLMNRVCMVATSSSLATGRWHCHVPAYRDGPFARWSERTAVPRLETVPVGKPDVGLQAHAAIAPARCANPWAYRLPLLARHRCTIGS